MCIKQFKITIHQFVRFIHAQKSLWYVYHISVVAVNATVHHNAF